MTHNKWCISASDRWGEIQMDVNQLLGQIIVSVLTSSTVTALAVWLVQKLLEHRLRTCPEITSDFPLGKPCSNTEVIFGRLLSILAKTTESRIQRLSAVFDNALDQAKSIHSLCALLRKKIVFAFDYPLDQPRRYATVVSLKEDLEESFRTLEVDFQQGRINLMLLDEELFEGLHQLKNAYGFIVRRVMDLIKLNGEELTLEQLHRLMVMEEACNAMHYEAERLFHNLEPRLTKMLKKLGG
jgi:hypothetical protein